MVYIPFSMGVDPFILFDTIIIPESVYLAWGQAGVDAEKQDRYDRWIAIVNPPPPPEE